MSRLDRTPPILTTRGSPSTITNLGSGRYGIFITSQHLRAWDRDSPAAALEFTIIGPPRFGYLENLQTGEASCSSKLVVVVPGQSQTYVLQERPSEGASRSRTWTTATSSTWFQQTWHSPTTASISSSLIRRETQHHLTCGFVRACLCQACPLMVQLLICACSLDLSWSRVQFAASCYRTCESEAELQIQIQRTGKSTDPAFVAIQVGSPSPRML